MQYHIRILFTSVSGTCKSYRSIEKHTFSPGTTAYIPVEDTQYFSPDDGSKFEASISCPLDPSALKDCMIVGAFLHTDLPWPSCPFIPLPHE
nr:hypothetical protein Iba_chr02bCG13840 [Ipomoea batatas]